MRTKVELKTAARIRSVFQLAAKYKTMKDQNEPSPVARRVGILERLKTTTDKSTIVALVAEFKTFADASAKTRRRFGRLLGTKSTV